MKKYPSKLALGSALCASSIAFAAEPASSVLSDQQMDLVTAGHAANQLPLPSSWRGATRQTINRTQGNTYHVSVSPTVRAYVALLNWRNQNVGSYTYQSGGTQSATNK